MNNSILAIAGSDSISGAGAQIDIKVAASLGVHATCAITAVTAQNTMGVLGVEQMSGEMVKAQIKAVFADVAPQAIKIGMLGSVEVAGAVAAELKCHPEVPVVLDPVLVATSGASLAQDQMVETLCELLLPLSTLVTPNLPEVLSLTGVDLINQPCGLGEQETREYFDSQMIAAASKLASFGVKNILIKGGHGCIGSDGQNNADVGSICIDRLYSAYDGSGDECKQTPPNNAELILELRSHRVAGEFHGTGCSLSTAIACGLAQGLDLKEAVGAAHQKINSMITHPTNMGKGCTIINPFALGNEAVGHKSDSVARR